jgi:superfamily II DNA or RNA helicase
VTAEHDAVDDCLRFTVPNAHIIKRKMGPRGRHWDGTKGFYDRRNCAFLTGLLGKVIMYLKSLGVAFEIMDKRTNPTAGTYAISNTLNGITLYDFQYRTVQEVIKAGRGVVQLPTGAGKTEIAIAVTKALSVPTLFLTHRVNLLYQTARRYAARNPEIESKIGIIGDGNYSPNFITLATVQTIWSALKRYPSEIVGTLKGFQMLIIDEAHRAGAKQFYKPAMLCSNAFYRLGLTATPFMGGNAENDLYLMGVTGPVASRVAPSELIERGILAKPFFKFFTISGPRLDSLRDWRDIYELGIIHHEERNHIIATQAAQLAARGKKTLIIVNEVAHGQILVGLCEKKGISVRYQDGRHSHSEREAALKWLSKTGDAIIATNIFDEGIDVKNINAVILAAGTKSAPALFQRTGRATRRKEVDNYAIIIDFIDKQHPKLAEHSIRRYNLIKREKGFTIL